MEQTARIISTYSADNFGVCSALYELGGMVIMHDPSGCNSTYTTHDEPRWYEQESLVFISAMTEQDAVLGRDNRLVEEICQTASKFAPSFICVIPSQIAYLIGTDLKALCRLIEKKTGIPAFTLPTNSMHYYEQGIYHALLAIARRAVAYTKQAPPKHTSHFNPTVNLLGITPLDFGPTGWRDSLKTWLKDTGFTLQSCWAMGSSLEEILASGASDLNLVASYGGLGAAKLMQAEFGIPYVCGLPIGSLAPQLAIAMRESLQDKKNRTPYLVPSPDRETATNYIIGETVTAHSLAWALADRYQETFLPIIPVESDRELLSGSALCLTDETELEPILAKAKTIIADPLYEAICPPHAKFIRLPHMGFSGRLYQAEIMDLVKEQPGLDD